MPEDNSCAYTGTELDLFREAANWKRYWAGLIREYLGPRVAEVGVGIGVNVPLLCSEAQSHFVGLEPDQLLVERARANVSAAGLAERCEIRVGPISSLGKDEQFDTMVYADVLEHIADDKTELEQAACHLASGGHLIVLSPAHQWLYSPFDAAIGHYRRYSRPALRALTPAGTTLQSIKYLDCAGMLASIANKLAIRSSEPTRRQIIFWDRFLVPASRLLDPLLRFSVGKSLLAVWRKV